MVRWVVGLTLAALLPTQASASCHRLFSEYSPAVSTETQGYPAFRFRLACPNDKNFPRYEIQIQRKSGGNWRRFHPAAFQFKPHVIYLKRTYWYFRIVQEEQKYELTVARGSDLKASVSFSPTKYIKR